MSIIRSVVLTACIMGIISSVINMIAPGGRLKKHLISFIGIAAIVSIISRFSSEGFRLSLRDINISSDTEYQTNNTSADVSAIFLEEAGARFDEYFMKLLNKNDISVANVKTKLKLSDDNELDIVEVIVTVDDLSQVSRAEGIISDEIGGDRVRVGMIEDEDASIVGR